MSAAPASSRVPRFGKSLFSAALALSASAAGAAVTATAAAADPSSGGGVQALALGWMRALEASLGSAAADPTPATLALALALVTLLPLAVVVPMTLICLAVAAKLPPLMAAGVILGGVAANTTIAWILARTVFGARIERWLQRRGGWLGALRDGARAEPLKWALLARYVPAPFVGAPMVLSTTGVGLGTTLLGSLLGMLPWTGVYLYVTHSGREASLPGISRAVGALAVFYIAVSILRKRMIPKPLPRAAAPVPGPLTPRRDALPLVELYTLAGDAASEDARAELSALRDVLGFEVRETDLASAGGELEALYRDHAPVALLRGERLFNYQMDENVLRARLARLKKDGRGFVIELDAVGKQFQGDIWALRDVSFKVDQGEFVLLSGPSGAGKSTLLSLLTLQSRPTRGRVLLEGTDLSKLSPSQVPMLRRRIGVVYQDFRLLYDRTVFENVAFVLRVLEAPENEIRRETFAALERCGLKDKAGLNPRKLSGGEQQRVAVARALVHDPGLILADEPTGNLDLETGWDVFRLLMAAHERGTTVLVATHNQAVLGNLAARRIVLRGGAVESDRPAAAAAPAGVLS